MADGAGEERVVSSAEILENYGIDSETDLLVLDQDDFSKLASRGLKPLHAKKLECWCESVCERVEVDMVVATHFLLVNPDFSKTEVVKAYAHSIVAPAIDYWKQTIDLR